MVKFAVNIHPDDLLFFHEVANAMKNVAKAYHLNLKSITHYKMPERGMSDRMGQCTASGDISLVLRCTVNGVWCDEPMSPDEVWDTAAHELAHLKHMNHGLEFQEFRLELAQALQNRKQDHKEKVIARLVKMQKSREGEAAIGNLEAAESFAAAINRMLIEYELHPSDIDYARTADNDPVIELPVNMGTYNIKVKKARIAWQESLARIVAKAHLCQFLIRQGSNQIWFVGTKSHATVAEYAYGIMVPAVEKMACYDYHKAQAAYAKVGENWRITGFSSSWHIAFAQRVTERFEEARRLAVSQASEPVPGGESTALLRLDGALVKVRAYINDKFKSRRGVSALNSMRGGSHQAGLTAGRAAADRMAIGRRGVAGAAAPKLLK
jgi:hypothetical protein